MGSGFITPPVQPGIWSGRVAFVSSSSFPVVLPVVLPVVRLGRGHVHQPALPAHARGRARRVVVVVVAVAAAVPCTRCNRGSGTLQTASGCRLGENLRSVEEYRAPAGNVPTAAAQKPSSGSLNVRFGTDAFSSLRVGDASSAAGVAVAVAAADHASSSFPSSFSSSSFSPFPSSASSRIARTATLNAYVAPGVSRPPPRCWYPTPPPRASSRGRTARSGRVGVQARVETVAPRVALHARPGEDIEPRARGRVARGRLERGEAGWDDRGIHAGRASSAGRTRGVAGGPNERHRARGSRRGPQGKDARLRLGGGDGGGDWSSSPRTARAWRKVSRPARTSRAREARAGVGVVAARARV